eukprot:gene8922-871_t
MKLIFAFVFCLVFLSVHSKLCPDYRDCKSCADATGCKWCPRDKKCHTLGSLINPCKQFNNVNNSTWCPCHIEVTPQCCTCKPQQGWTVDSCRWYKGVSGSQNPKEW